MTLVRGVGQYEGKLVSVEPLSQRVSEHHLYISSGFRAPDTASSVSAPACPFAVPH